MFYAAFSKVYDLEVILKITVVPTCLIGIKAKAKQRI